jgi:hypothetical protein
VANAQKASWWFNRCHSAGEIHVDAEDVRGRLVLDAPDEHYRTFEELGERSGEVLGVEILAGGASTGRGIRQSGKQRPP